MDKLLRNYRDFSGGLSEVSNDNMADNQLALAVNTIPGETYGIAKATGYDIAYPQISGGEEIIEVLALKPAAGLVQTLAFTPTKLYKYDSAMGTWTSLATGLSAILDYFIHANKLWWLDGSEFRNYDGTTVSTVTMTTAGETPTTAETELWSRIKISSCVEQRGTRWFFARSGSNEVIFSKINDPTAFEVTSIINVNTKNADTITALREFSDGMLIFKEKSVHFLTGWDFATGTDIELSQLNVTSGTAFPKTVQKIENAVLYLGYNGVYQLRIPSLSTVLAADNISNNLISETLEQNGTIGSRAVVWSNIYYLTVENASGIKEYRYYTKLKAFFGEFTMPSYCYSTSLEDNKLYIGCENGYILVGNPECYHYINTTTGANTAIQMEAMTKGFDIVGSMVADAKVKKIFIASKQFEAQTSRPYISIKADYSATSYNVQVELNTDESLVWGEGIWGSAYWGFISTVTKEIPVNYKAKRVQFTIGNDYIDEPTLIYGIGVLYKKKNPKGSRDGVTERTVV